MSDEPLLSRTAGAMLPGCQLPEFSGISLCSMNAVRAAPDFPKSFVIAGEEWFYIDDLDRWRWRYTNIILQALADYCRTKAKSLDLEVRSGIESYSINSNKEIKQEEQDR